MDPETRARFDDMIHEIRSWERAPAGAVEDLARRYSLDPLVVERVLESELGVSPQPRPKAARIIANRPTREIRSMNDTAED